MRYRRLKLQCVTIIRLVAFSVPYMRVSDQKNTSKDIYSAYLYQCHAFCTMFSLIFGLKGWNLCKYMCTFYSPSLIPTTDWKIKCTYVRRCMHIRTYIPAGLVRVANRGMKHSIVRTTCTVTNNLAISAEEENMMKHTLSLVPRPCWR